MVSTRFESSNYKPWKSVARPVPKPDSKRVRAPNGPPAVLPKPGGKMFVYVYEAPENRVADQVTKQVGYGTMPPKSQLIICDQEPKQNGSMAPAPPAGQPSINDNYQGDNTIKRLKKRAKKAGKGYKILADVTAGSLRSSSKGGRMFIKQKERMDNYTSLAYCGKQKDEWEEVDPDSYERSMSALDGGERSTPWNMAKVSPAAVKYIPTSLYKNNFARDRSVQKGRILRPLRSPPPEWRMKVESGYKLYDDQQHSLPTRRWNSVDSTRSRSESAPLDDEFMQNGFGSEDRRERIRPGSASGPQSESGNGGAPAVVINFDAKMHHRAPHRKQGVRAGRGIFMTTPFARNDFNARAIGWSRAYAEHY